MVINRGITLYELHNFTFLGKVNFITVVEFIKNFIPL
jgi:hypothetical protein